MPNTFTAVDFETAQGYGWSICQVGLVRVEQGVVVNEVSLLVQPPDNYYWYRFTEIHGITPRHTAFSPTFDRVWPDIAHFIENQTVVAHNGLSFDFPVLRKTLSYYGLPEPEYTRKDTCRIYRKGLAKLCELYNIPLNHHDALSDARACAELYKMFLDDSTKP